MPRLNIPSPAAIEHQRRKQQPRSENHTHAPRPYDPREDARFYQPPAQPEATEDSYTFSLN